MNTEVIKINKKMMATFYEHIEAFNNEIVSFMEIEEVVVYLSHSHYMHIRKVINEFATYKELSRNKVQAYKVWLYLTHLIAFIDNIERSSLDERYSEMLHKRLHPIAVEMIKSYEKVLGCSDIMGIEKEKMHKTYNVLSDPFEVIMRKLYDFNYVYEDIYRMYGHIIFSTMGVRGDIIFNNIGIREGLSNISIDNWSAIIDTWVFSDRQIKLKNIVYFIDRLIAIYDVVHNLLYKKYRYMLHLADGDENDKKLLEAVYSKIYRHNYLLNRFNNSMVSLYRELVEIWANIILER